MQRDGQLVRHPLAGSFWLFPAGTPVIETGSSVTVYVGRTVRTFADAFRTTRDDGTIVVGFARKSHLPEKLHPMMSESDLREDLAYLRRKGFVRSPEVIAIQTALATRFGFRQVARRRPLARASRRASAARRTRRATARAPGRLSADDDPPSPTALTSSRGFGRAFLRVRWAA
jgi:hypothetical protein